MVRTIKVQFVKSEENFIPSAGTWKLPERSVGVGNEYKSDSTLLD